MSEKDRFTWAVRDLLSTQTTLWRNPLIYGHMSYIIDRAVKVPPLQAKGLMPWGSCRLDETRVAPPCPTTYVVRTPTGATPPLPPSPDSILMWPTNWKKGDVAVSRQSPPGPCTRRGVRPTR